MATVAARSLRSVPPGARGAGARGARGLLPTANPVPGGLAAFAPTIIGTIAFENAMWLVAFVLGNEALALAVQRWLGRGVRVARGS